MKRGTIINNRIIKKEPQTQKLTERTNTDTLQDLSIPLRGGGERHPAAVPTRHTEVVALRDLHNLSKGEVKFLSEQRELRNLGGGQLCAYRQNDYVTLNLFQGLANVAEGDELHTKTAVKCDKARFRNKFGMTSKKSGNLECHIA